MTTVNRAQQDVNKAMQAVKGGTRRTLDAMLRGKYKKVKPHNSRPVRQRCAGAMKGCAASQEQLKDWRKLMWSLQLMAGTRPEYKKAIHAACHQYDALLLREAGQRRGGRPKGAKDRQGRAIANRLQPITIWDYGTNRL